MTSTRTGAKQRLEEHVAAQDQALAQAEQVAPNFFLAEQIR